MPKTSPETISGTNRSDFGERAPKIVPTLPRRAATPTMSSLASSVRRVRMTSAPKPRSVSAMGAGWTRMPS